MTGANSHMADLAACLVKGPRTIREIATYLGTEDRLSGRQHQLITNRLRSFRAAGLVYVAEWRGTATALAPVYAWQPSIAERPDAPRPTKESKCNKR